MSTAAPGRAGRAHPLFEKAAENRRYAGPLDDLLPTLRPEAFERQGGWAWRVLPRGAVISMRVRGDMDMRKELRIARAEPPETPEQDARWQQEVGIFLRHFGITAVDGETPAESVADHWLKLPDDPEDAGKAAVRFLQLRQGELHPGKARCHRCHLAGVANLIEWSPGPKATGQLCTPHRFEAGREHVAEVKARLGRA